MLSTIFCTCLISFSVSFRELSCGRGCCALASYFLGSGDYGQCWIHCMMCSYFNNCFFKYPGIEISTRYALLSHSSEMPQYKLPVQSSLSLYVSSFKQIIKWSACSFPAYLTPKSSTTSVNVLALVACRHSPGVLTHS